MGIDWNLTVHLFCKYRSEKYRQKVIIALRFQFEIPLFLLYKYKIYIFDHSWLLDACMNVRIRSGSLNTLSWWTVYSWVRACAEQCNISKKFSITPWPAPPISRGRADVNCVRAHEHTYTLCQYCLRPYHSRLCEGKFLPRIVLIVGVVIGYCTKIQLQLNMV